MQLKSDLRVLMVEDNPGDQYLLTELLYSSGITERTILVASSSEEAIQLLQTNKPDIILLDLSLPDTSGIESFQSINQHAKKIPVVILSGMRNMKLALDAITLGAQDYLIKGDFDEKLLTKTIIYAIERMNNLQALQESNERYNLVSKATNDMVWDWDLTTGEVYRNEEGWRKIFRTAPGKEIGSEMDWDAKIHPEDKKHLSEIKQNIFEQLHNDFFEIEVRVIRDDGTVAYIHDRGYVVRREDGKPTRLIGATQDITEKKRTEQMLRDEQFRKQKEITDAVIVAQEKERQKIGAELHDNVNQILASSLLFLNLTRKNGQDKKKLLEQTDEMINKAINEIRKLSHTIIPPSLNEQTLKDSLEKLAEVAELSGIFGIDRDLDLIEEESIPEKLKLTIYRIAQEQLNNIIKYAKATVVGIHLSQQENGIQLIISDDGVGFDPSKKSKGVGLMNIQTRAQLHNGTVRISSSPGNGCILRASFPILHEIPPAVEKIAQAVVQTN